MGARSRISSDVFSTEVSRSDAAAGRHVVERNGRTLGCVLLPLDPEPVGAAPLVILLHGAGGTSEQGLRLLEPFASTAGMIVVAPQSRRQTWDLILGGYGADVEAIEQLLRWTLERRQASRSHFAIGGFSDGASYALSLGLDNGDAFTHIVALSPGFAAPADPRGKPRIFVSHGVLDRVLPIQSCSRRITPQLKKAGYSLEYREFDGEHTVPTNVAQHATRWLMDAPDVAV